MQLFDHDTKTLADVPEDQATEAMRSGRYSPLKGTVVPIVSPDGTPGSVSPEQAYEFLNRGYRVETSGEINDRRMQAKYGEGAGNELAAGLAGAARGATLGLSDVLAAGVGGKPVQEALAGLRQYNPSASLGGELAGAAIPAIASGGSSALGLAPAGLVARAGLAAEGATGLALGKGAATAAGRILQTVIPKAAGSAVEGAFYGAGGVLSEAALGDHELTAERLMAHAGLGALIGGAAGAGMTIPGMAVRGGVHLAGVAASSTKRAIEDLYEKATGAKAAAGLGDSWSRSLVKASSLVSGEPESIIAPLAAKGAEGEAARAAATIPQHTVDQAADRLRSTADELQEAIESIRPETAGAGKLKQYANKVRTGNESETVPVAQNLVRNLDMSLEGMITAGSGEYGHIADLRQMRKLIDKTRERMWEAINGGDPNINAQIYVHLDDLKRDLGRYASRQFGRGVTSSADNATKTVLGGQDGQGGFYELFRQTLEDAGLWGEAAATQKAVNEKWTKLLSSENYRNNFFVPFGSEGFQQKWRANDKAFRSFVDNLRDESSLDLEYITNHVQSKKELAQEILKHYNLEPEQRAVLDNAVSAADDFRRTLSSVKTQVIRRNQLRQLEGAPQAFGTLGLGALGFVAGGPVGAAIGAGLGALNQPGRSIRQLATLERISKGFGGRIESSVKAMLSEVGRRASSAGQAVTRGAIATERAGQRLAAPVSVSSAMASDRAHERDDRSVIRDFKGRVQRLSEFVDNPEVSAKTLATNLAGFHDVAPNVAQAMSAKAMAAAMFLRDKAPTPPLSISASMTPKTWKPTLPDIAKWNRYVNAVENPMSIVDSLRRGTLTREQVETARAVYPKLADDISATITKQLAQLKGELPAKQRQQLAVWFGAPVDATTSPAFGASVQAMHASEQAAAGMGQAAQGPRPRKTKTKIPDMNTTKSERIEAR